MTPRRQAVKKAPTEEHWSERIDFTLRPDAATWKRLVKHCRAIEDETGKAPSKNTLIIEALREWLDRQDKRKR